MSGVYTAATDPINRILQPSDLDGVGEYRLRAGVVTPTLNVLCVNVAHFELAPLIYTTWPNARTVETNVPGQRIGVESWPDWTADVPVATSHEWLNRTAVDHIFRWGAAYGRRPPVFSAVSLVAT